MVIFRYIKWLVGSWQEVCRVASQERLKQDLDMSDKDVLELQIAEREVKSFGRYRQES